MHAVSFNSPFADGLAAFSWSGKYICLQPNLIIPLNHRGVYATESTWEKLI